MRRRSVLTAIAGGTCLSGCLSQGPNTAPESTTAPPNGTETATPIRRTAEGITASFHVVDGHAPTEDTASATFDDEQVTVTGTMDPSGCNRPMLSAVRYNATDGVIHLRIGGESQYGTTATVECGNASFDYRSVLSTDRGRPTTVELVHIYQGKDNQSFNLEHD